MKWEEVPTVEGSYWVSQLCFGEVWCEPRVFYLKKDLNNWVVGDGLGFLMHKDRVMGPLEMPEKPEL